MIIDLIIERHAPSLSGSPSLPHQRDCLDCRLIVGGIVLEDTLPPAVEDERLSKWVNMLNTKMDYLISLSAPRQEEVLSMNFEPLTISVSGMALIAKEPFDKGDLLEIRIVLQVYPAKILLLFGDVVRIEPTLGRPESYTVGVNFLNMDEKFRKKFRNSTSRNTRKG